MKKFDAFLENIGLKNTATGEKKPLGKVIGAIVVIILVALVMIIGNNWISSAISSNNKKQEVEFNLKGMSTMVLYIGQEYQEPGYEAFDENGKDISKKVEVIGQVNNDVAGIYEINYRLNYGKTTSVKKRTVTVVDKSEPVFILLGESDINIKKGSEYLEPGYFVMLPGENDASKFVTVIGDVNVNVPGVYRIVYKLDYNDLKIELVRNVNVVGESTLVPTITLIGNKSITLGVNEKYEEPGYSASDSIDGDITNNVTIKNNIKNGVPGIYEVVYTVKNSRGFENSTSRVVKISSSNGNSLIFSNNDEINKYVDVVPSTSAVTKDAVSLKITVKSPDVKSIILPDNTIVTTNEFKYTVKENGTYIIIVQLQDGTLINGSVVIDNIDNEPPTGTCQAIYQNGKVSFIVNASDNEPSVEIDYDEYDENEFYSSNGIDGYSYYNGENYSEFTSKNTFESQTKMKSGYHVIIKDKVGNTNKIDCSSQTLSSVTGIKIVGESKAVLGDKVYLQVVFTPENVENKSVNWQIIEGSKFGTINEGGLVTITGDGRYLLETENYIVVQATSADGGLSATHKITIYLDEKRLNESGVSVSGTTGSNGIAGGGGSSASGGGGNGGTGSTSGLAAPNGIKLTVGEEKTIDISQYKNDKGIILTTSDKNIVEIKDNNIIVGKSIGTVEVKVVKFSMKNFGDMQTEELKSYVVSVVDPFCATGQDLFMEMEYHIGEEDSGGNLVFGEWKTIDNEGKITIGLNQFLRVRLKLSQKCGETLYLTEARPRVVEENYTSYFNTYTNPIVNRTDSKTFKEKQTSYTWYIKPLKVTGEQFVKLDQKSRQYTTVYPEIVSRAIIYVRVTEKNVDIGKKESITPSPATIIRAREINRFK